MIWEVISPNIETCTGTLPSHNFFIEQCIRLLYQRTTYLEVIHKRAEESKIILIRQTIKVFDYNISKTTKKA